MPYTMRLFYGIKTIMTDKNIIMRDSPEAASIQTVTGWVSSIGRFWGADEHMARFDGATHQKCDKNPSHPVYEINSYCRACRDEVTQARFADMPRRAWDGETPLCLYDTDEYFSDADSIRDYLIDNEIELAYAQLVFCTPNKACEIDANEHFADDLPEDGEVSAELGAAFDVLNEVIRRQEPLSWFPGKEVAILPPNFLE